MIKYKIKCPRCNNKMLYAPRVKVQGKKACVYCGFKIIIKDNIIGEEKGEKK